MNKHKKIFQKICINPIFSGTFPYKTIVFCPKCDGCGWINEPYYDENHQMKIGPDCPVCKHFGYITINSFLFYETIEKRKNKGSAVTKETRARKKFVAQFNQ
jgi:hypothetical protein